MTPGSLEYVIGRPFVDRAVLALPNGKRLTISTEGLDAAHPYVGGVTLNGAAVTKAYLRHDQIVAGGTLHFRMQATPDKAWATGAADRPFSTSTPR